MSIRQKPITESDRRRSYQLVSEEQSDSDLAVINVDIWQHRYNIEWRTAINVKEFAEILDTGTNWVTDDTTVVCYIGDEHTNISELITSFSEMMSHKDFPELFGNVCIVEDGVFDLYWEETKNEHTLELTMYQENNQIFEFLYEQTALEGAPDTEDITIEIQKIL